MSRGQGGIKNYEFNKLGCPQCGRLTAVSYTDPGWIRWRSHQPCGGSVRRDQAKYEMAEYEKTHQRVER